MTVLVFRDEQFHEDRLASDESVQSASIRHMNGLHLDAELQQMVITHIHSYGNLAVIELQAVREH